jgi:hypothetical protein
VSCVSCQSDNHAAYVAECKSPYQAVVAFAGDYDYDGAKLSEFSLMDSYRVEKRERC